MAQKITQIVRSEGIAANGTVDNVLANEPIQNIPNDDNYLLRVWATASAFGVRHQLRADVDTLVEESPVGGTDRIPQTQEDFLGQWPLAGGTKLFIKVVNNDAAAQNYNVRIEAIPMSQL